MRHGNIKLEQATYNSVLTLGVIPEWIKKSWAGVFLLANALVYAQATSDYELGKRIGEALRGGCEVVAATVVEVGDAQKIGDPDVRRATTVRPLLLRASHWLVSTDETNPTELRLDHYTRPQISKSGSGPWSAWADSKPATGASWILGLRQVNARSNIWQGTPESVAFVVAHPDLKKKVEQLLSTHFTLATNAAPLLRQMTMASQVLEPIVAGYLLSFAIERQAFEDVDGAARNVGILYTNSALPVAVRIDLLSWLSHNFYRLSTPQRKEVTRLLVERASDPSDPLCQKALAALVRFGDDGILDLKPLLTETRRRMLVEQYQSFLTNNWSRGKHLRFEEELGFLRH